MIPFFVLLPKPAKRNPAILARIAVVVLIGRWVDLCLMVFPATLGDAPLSTFDQAPHLVLLELAALGGLIATSVLLFGRTFAAASPVPQHHPYLKESLHYRIDDRAHA